MKAFLLACALALAALPARADTVMAIVSSSPSEWVGQGQTKTYTNANATFTVSGNNTKLQLRVAGTDGKTWDLVLKAPVGDTFRPHEYWFAEREGFETGRAPSMDFSGDGRACGNVYGDFKIRQISYDAHGNVSTLEATVLQRCQSENAAPLAVTVLYRASKLSFSVIAAPGDWGPGLNVTLYNDVSRITGSGDALGTVYFTFSGMGLEFNMPLTPPPGQARFQKGMYLTERFQSGASAGMDQYGNNVGGDTSYGRLEIISITYDPNGYEVRQLTARYTFYTDATRTKVTRSGGINFWQ